MRRRVALALCLRGTRNLGWIVSSISPRRWGSSQSHAALATELERGLVLGTTAEAELDKLRTTLTAEFHRRRIVELTALTPHKHAPSASCGKSPSPFVLTTTSLCP